VSEEFSVKRANWIVYIDDTADERRENYVCAGALMGDRERWSVFNKTWRKALQTKPAISYYHGKEVHRLEGQFVQFRDKTQYLPPAGRLAANTKRAAMKHVISNSGLIGFGAGVFVSTYDRIRNSEPRAKFFMPEHPFSYVLQEVIYRTTTALVEHVGKTNVEFISDAANRAPEYERIYEEWKVWNPETAKSMLGLCHGSHKTHYGLQAADIAASTVNHIFKSHLASGVTENFDLDGVFWRIGHIDEKYLLDVLQHQTVREAEKTP
jgi:hypothetical protein